MSTASFFLSAAIALLAALAAVVVRRPRRSLGAFAVALAALIVPLVQLRAPAVAAVVLLATAVVVVLLAGVAELDGRLGPRAQPRPGSPVSWALGGAGLLGFCWLVLATGSRQVVEAMPVLPQGAAFGRGSAVLARAAADHVVPGLLVGLLALCCVIAAVLTLVTEGGDEAS